ncbi:4-formylbenzenesulfonate dehydrogenase TsaC1/TsaC2 [Roseovarius sp. EC-HK134]|uniref:4-formylbenzenesulfonate dehydrogenase TsaC1/TsaC2 n=1 Tax=Roseovarius mucosus TaxID=215743 RepID=A0A1V0RMY8_9RHOB|nr:MULTISPECIES: SDR family oxidoreductase [Roseovarius]ARE83143.1 4-formylbenzenesulfonate dehydrogenase TsaC1/TsaC2 [Roseovarius mucosus]AWZ20234.1 Toluenesulfonate zinc-independent alcohol dehydrogenase [Roseovarius sp. AK1035]MBW4974431.1 SDR family oxidoreductase [Roseovarius mucosus]VVT16108.1 4-formylbenzenesulfonate dehydrogenase TsaC1/TsaC2 [Roseovarius sp. EC-HK134]VVT16686.1 4-formylbenzenesulfonate dehydrogenase TsaC1/TsaC2 [Roseovarius sp. EC-SD190]
MRLDGKRALVTGAASGFGKGIAETYIREGAKVAVVDMNADGARAVARDLGENAIAVTCDVSKGDQVQAAVDATVAAFGGLDIVVNNAGWTNPNSPLMDTDEATFRKIYEINVLSIFHMTKTCVPLWRAAGGGVMINIGSTAGIRPRPGLTWYNSSKGAVNLMTRSLAAELAPDKIRVCCIAPVMGATGLLEQFMGMPDTPENRARFISTIPMGRLSEARDIANAALYLASDEADFITGVVLEVDGGRTI